MPSAQKPAGAEDAERALSRDQPCGMSLDKFTSEGSNAAAGADMLETEGSDPQPSQAGPYLMGSTQKY